MAWQLLAMWVLVIGTIVWFVRDERRLIANAAMAQASQFNAHAPVYHYQTSEPPAPPSAPAEPVAMPAKRPAGLSQTQRDFLKALAKVG